MKWFGRKAAREAARPFLLRGAWGAAGAEARAAARRDRVAERLADAAPQGIEVAREGESVVLCGRGLARRFASEAELRWLVAEMRDDDEGAAAAIAGAVTAALGKVAGLSGVFDGAPVQAGDAHALVEIGPASDWGHKSGAGAEVRFAVLIRCGGERPVRARALSHAARAAVEAIGPELPRWRLVSLAMLRTRVVAATGNGARKGEGPGWTGVIDYRARLLRAQD